MKLSLRIFLIILLLIQMFLIIHRIKSKKISMKYASLWILVIFLLILASIFPSIIINLSKLFGFEASSNMVFLLGFFVMFYIAFILSISISKQNEKVKCLIQELALLEKRVEKFEERK